MLPLSVRCARLSLRISSRRVTRVHSWVHACIRVICRSEIGGRAADVGDPDKIPTDQEETGDVTYSDEVAEKTRVKM